MRTYTPTYVYFLFHEGGSVSTPLNSIENDAITRIGDEFYEACEAKSQSGKTLWIGIQRDNEGNWTVSRKGIEYFMNQINKKVLLQYQKTFALILKDLRTKEKISYQNFREGQGKGSSTCVYLLTRTGSSQVIDCFCLICNYIH